MDVSIVITTCDRYNDLLKCIDSIIKSDLSGINYEILVVDDCSKDETKDLSENAFAAQTVRVIHNSSNLMMVKSRNLGAHVSKGNLIIFIDDDNEIDPQMIRQLYKVANEKNSLQIGVIGPSMYYFDTKEKYLDFQKINLWTGKTTGHTIEAKNEIKIDYYDSDGIPNVFAVKKEVFEKCGYFDERLIQTYTEPDFSYKVKQSGYRTVTIPQAKTFHKISKNQEYSSRSLGGQFTQKAYCLMRNRGVLVQRYGSLLQKIVYFGIFGWIWPLVYSALIYKEKPQLIKYYMVGTKDAYLYLITKKLNNSLESLMK